MAEHSGGILVYKYMGGKLMVMLAHPGGPFWAKRMKLHGQSLKDCKRRANPF